MNNYFSFNRRTRILLAGIIGLIVIFGIVLFFGGDVGKNGLTGTAWCQTGSGFSLVCPTPTPTGLAIVPKPFTKPTHFTVNGCTIMPGTQCPGANLIGVSLSYAQLIGADLTGANLSISNLTSADLSLAKLTNAVLTGTNLESANLYNSTGANFTGARLCHTTMPDGTKSDRDCALPTIALPR